MEVLSDRDRKAAHGKHLCDFCWKPIAAREVYNDCRLADGGTAWTWRSHLRCQAFLREVTDPYDWGHDGIDAVEFAEYVRDNPEAAARHGVT